MMPNVFHLFTFVSEYVTFLFNTIQEKNSNSPYIETMQCPDRDLHWQCKYSIYIGVYMKMNFIRMYDL